MIRKAIKTLVFGNRPDPAQGLDRRVLLATGYNPLVKIEVKIFF
jgi:hypothetical protein